MTGDTMSLDEFSNRVMIYFCHDVSKLTSMPTVLEILWKANFSVIDTVWHLFCFNVPPRFNSDEDVTAWVKQLDTKYILRPNDSDLPCKV